MPTKTLPCVTMRVKIGDAELEVSGPREFVEEKVAKFVSELGAKGEKAAPFGRHLSEATQKNGNGHKVSTLAQLLRKVAVKSDVDRVLVAGYYLETAEDARSFTAGEIKDAIRGAKAVLPGNLSDIIAKNIKQGLMMHAGDKDGRMAYVLTTDGVEFVAEQLKA